MSAKETKNLLASVLERLRSRSKSSGAPFQQVLQQYAVERFLYRISKSKHAHLQQQCALQNHSATPTAA